MSATKPPAPLPADKILNKMHCEFPDCESELPVSYRWEWDDEFNGEIVRRKVYICSEHEDITINRGHTIALGFNSKDGMRNHAYRLARLQPGQWNRLRGSAQRVYLYLIDRMWTGEEGTESQGYVMKRFASVRPIMRDLGLDYDATVHALKYLESHTDLVYIEGHDSEKDKNGDTRMLIDCILLNLYKPAK